MFSSLPSRIFPSFYHRQPTPGASEVPPRARAATLAMEQGNNATYARREEGEHEKNCLPAHEPIAGWQRVRGSNMYTAPEPLQLRNPCWERKTSHSLQTVCDVRSMHATTVTFARVETSDIIFVRCYCRFHCTLHDATYATSNCRLAPLPKTSF